MRSIIYSTVKAGIPVVMPSARVAIAHWQQLQSEVHRVSGGSTVNLMLLII